MKTINQIEKLNREAAKNNAAYKAASRAERRVMLAEDALAQLRRNKYTATCGTYFAPVIVPDDQNLWSELGQAELLNPKTVCDVCAIGSVLVSHIRFANKHKLGADDMDPCIASEITNWPEANLRLMEDAFEIRDDTLESIEEDYANLGPKVIAAKRFGLRFDDETRRLRAILRNVIENKGLFVPPMKKAA